MTSQEQFFYDNAGFSWTPATETEAEGKLRCARDLARSITWAQANDYSFEWRGDIDADPNDWDGDGPIGESAYGCILKDFEGKVIGSLWGIWDPSSSYMRVVEAELASEALYAIEAEERNVRECDQMMLA